MKKQIPNLITLGNLLCGVLACYIAPLGYYKQAAALICAGIFLDFFDGMAARLLKVPSEIGKQLDSLADVVTSGVAPGLIMMDILTHGRYDTFCYVALFIPLFAAYRLAKFNVDSRQSHSFRGLPAPANAMIWVGVALGGWKPCMAFGWQDATVLFTIVATCILMVSDISMFSLKFNFHDMRWRENRAQYIFLSVCAVIIALTRSWYAISIIIGWYVALSIATIKWTKESEQ